MTAVCAKNAQRDKTATGTDGYTLSPRSLARLKKRLPIPSEHSEQAAFLQWLSMQYPAVYDVAYAIPNGGARNAVTGAMLKAEGVKAGMPDLCIPIARNGSHALYIEMKKRKGGQVSTEQKKRMEGLLRHGNACVICHGAQEAMDAVEEYLGGGMQL